MGSKKDPAASALPADIFNHQQYASHMKMWGKAWHEWKLRCMCQMAKEKYIDSNTIQQIKSKDLRHKGPLKIDLM